MSFVEGETKIASAAVDVVREERREPERERERVCVCVCVKPLPEASASDRQTNRSNRKLVLLAESQELTALW